MVCSLRGGRHPAARAPRSIRRRPPARPHPDLRRPADILEQARMTQGIERVEQIKYAVLERSGGASIIPWPSEAARRRPYGTI
ncbi:hypothetical protein E0L93_10980 [Rubrobacter taiwanensis]|uniref:Uncharacterized protein n=1 Tax=Rubrobacter taiwanensis TaxID=185139 RepID=A0A4R1BFQ2_9ACTN|nr:hypothetical protein E0L93_10980 [Rubrobacter taiwanensis]